MYILENILTWSDFQYTKKKRIYIPSSSLGFQYNYILTFNKNWTKTTRWPLIKWAHSHVYYNKSHLKDKDTKCLAFLYLLAQQIREYAFWISFFTNQTR